MRIHSRGVETCPSKEGLASNETCMPDRSTTEVTRLAPPKRDLPPLHENGLPRTSMPEKSGRLT
eukprot:12076174-Karenia_brevis.AAC.1